MTFFKKPSSYITQALPAFLCQLLLLFILILTKNFVFATNDDTTMVAILGGGYGTPSPYACNFHFLLGYILKSFFSFLPGINWYTLFLLFVYLLSFLLIDITFAAQNFSGIRFWGCVAVINICTLILLSYFTFTVAAYLAGITGLLLFTHAIYHKRFNFNFYTVFGTIMIIMAGLIRAEVFITLAVAYFSMCIYAIIKEKNFRYITVIVSCLLIMVVMIQSNTMLINRDSVQKEFLEWGETRSEALDCAPVPYNKEKFDEKGISKSEYLAMYNAFYYSYDVVSLENFNSLIELNSKSNRYNIDAVGFLPYFLKPFKSVKNITTFTNLYKILFLFVFLSCILFCKKQRLFTFFVLLFTMLSEFTGYFVRRPIYRVIMPNYIIAILLLLLICRINRPLIEKIKSHHISFKSIFCTVSVLLTIFAGTIFIKDNTMNKSLCSYERRQIISYLEKHEDTLFIAGDANVFSIDIARSVWDYAGRDVRWNLIGNWETYSVPYYNLVSYYPVEHPKDVVLDAINNDKIMILTSSNMFPEKFTYILDLIEEHYGIRPRFEKVDDICDNWINENWFEHWGTYKLVL